MAEQPKRQRKPAGNQRKTNTHAPRPAGRRDESRENEDGPRPQAQQPRTPHVKVRSPRRGTPGWPQQQARAQREAEQGAAGEGEPRRTEQPRPARDERGGGHGDRPAGRRTSERPPRGMDREQRGGSGESGGREAGPGVRRAGPHTGGAGGSARSEADARGGRGYAGRGPRPATGPERGADRSPRAEGGERGARGGARGAGPAGSRNQDSGLRGGRAPERGGRPGGQPSQDAGRGARGGSERPARTVEPGEHQSGGPRSGASRGPRPYGRDERGSREFSRGGQGGARVADRPPRRVLRRPSGGERRPRKAPAHRYLLFFKPYGVLSSFTDPDGEGRPSLGDYIHVPGVYAAGRLDQDSEGLMLLTDDGELSHLMTHPQHHQPKTYLVQVEGVPDEDALATLRRGVLVKGEMTAPAEVELLDGEPALPPRAVPIRYRPSVPTSWLRLVLREGRKRQIRHMTAAVGFPTLRLIRVSIGPLQVSRLQPGEWRELSEYEVGLLRQSLGAEPA